MDDRTRKYAIIAAMAVAGTAAIAMITLYSQPKNVPLDMGNPLQAQTGGPAVPNAGKQDLSEKAPDPTIPATIISISPATVQAGGQATVSGDGFSPESPVTISIDNSSISAGKIVADGSGRFSTLITLPKVQNGDHSISTQDDSGRTASAVLSIN